MCTGQPGLEPLQICKPGAAAPRVRGGDASLRDFPKDSVRAAVTFSVSIPSFNAVEPSERVAGAPYSTPGVTHFMLNAPAAPTYQSGKPLVTPSGSGSDEARGIAWQFLGELAAEVSSGTVDLPCFPDIVIRIRNALAEPKNTPEETVTIVGAEPRLAARLLQTANSAAFNPGGKPLTDLRSAITRLGHQLVQSAAMAFAVQHLKDENSLRPIAKPLTELWKQSIAVASICQVVARRTRISPDEAFLTGLLHGIGRLYIMVRAVGKMSTLGDREVFLDLVSSWHSGIGKTVLENWGFAAEMSDAVGDQGHRERRRKQDAGLSDILIVSIVLGETLEQPPPRTIEISTTAAFATIGLSVQDCATILTHAEYQLRSLQDALGC
jgi:HD-like signal output (HDOD) protein